MCCESLRLPCVDRTIHIRQPVILEPRDPDEWLTTLERAPVHLLRVVIRRRDGNGASGLWVGGPNSVGLVFNDGSIRRARAIDLTPSGINLHSGHAMDAIVTYDGLYLTLDLEDIVTGIHFEHNFPIPAVSPIGATSLCRIHGCDGSADE